MDVTPDCAGADSRAGAGRRAARLGRAAFQPGRNGAATARPTPPTTPTTLPGTLVCNESNPACAGGDADAVAAHVYAGDTYNFYLNNSRPRQPRQRRHDAHLDRPLRSRPATRTRSGTASQMVYGDGFSLGRRRRRPRADARRHASTRRTCSTTTSPAPSTSRSRTCSASSSIRPTAAATTRRRAVADRRGLAGSARSATCRTRPRSAIPTG